MSNDTTHTPANMRETVTIERVLAARRGGKEA